MMKKLSHFHLLCVIFIILGAIILIKQQIHLLPPEEEAMYEDAHPFTIYHDSEEKDKYITAKNRLKEIISARGSREAYEYYKKEFKGNADYRFIFHNLGFWLGTEIYKKEGFSGLNICDPKVGPGCTGGLLAKAAAIDGTSIFIKIENICKGDGKNHTKSVGCFHAFGHGIMATHQNYNPQTLTLALSDCNSFVISEFLKKMCSSGVYMEYNLKSIKSGLETVMFDSRQYNPAAPLEPCPKLPKIYQASCYYFLPYWWNAILKSDFSEMGKLCLTTAKEYQENCFRGIGQIAPWTARDDHKQIVQLCQKMPDVENMYLCIEEAAKILTMRNQKNPTQICETFEDGTKTRCIQASQKFLCDHLSKCN